MFNEAKFQMYAKQYPQTSKVKIKDKTWKCRHDNHKLPTLVIPAIYMYRFCIVEGSIASIIHAKEKLWCPLLIANKD